MKRGTSCSISVVLPLPDQPAKPNTFMRALEETGPHVPWPSPNLLIAKVEFYQGKIAFRRVQHDCHVIER